VTTYVRYLTLAIAAAGCGFSSPDPDLPDVIPPAPMPTPQPCGTDETGVVLCVDFEDESLVAQATDRSPFRHVVNAHDVERVERPPVGEDAALLTPVSSLLVAEAAALDVASFTIEMWIRPDQIVKYKGWDGDVGLFDNPGHYAMRLREDFRIRCGLANVREIRATSEGAVQPRTWSHVACTYDGDEMRVYVNGQLSGCEALAPTGPGGALGSAIGAEIKPGTSPLDVKDRLLGGVDDVRIYDRALPAERICRAAGHTAPASCQSECPSDEADD
jgi:hypothetical protein